MILEVASVHDFQSNVQDRNKKKSTEMAFYRYIQL